MIATEPATPTPLAEEQRVTPLELFFDLVFVFAITQVTTFITHDPRWLRLAEGTAILSLLWFAWEAYAWLENTAASDEGAMRLALLVAMGAMLLLSLTVLGAFGKNALTFGIAYLVVRGLHLVGYLIVSRDDPELRGVVRRLATTMLPAVLLIVLAGALDGAARGICWAAALTIDNGGLLVRGVEGWRVEPGHFAERHGLIIIIALGESIVAIGVGASSLGLTAGVATAALLGGAIAAAMWWLYFDFVSLVGEHRLRSAPPEERVRIARDSYTYLHLPMVAGIVAFAVGVKVALAHPSHALESVVAAALTAGAAIYLIACLMPLALALAAWITLAALAAITWTLVSFETIRYAEFRRRARRGQLA